MFCFEIQFYIYQSLKVTDLMSNDRRTGHQREKSWPHRHHMLQRIQQKRDDRTHVWHQSPPPLLSFFEVNFFHTSTQNGLLRLLPALHCPAPRAWLRAHGKKNTTLFHQMPDSYKSWHAHKKAGKCPLSAVLVLCHLQLWWAELKKIVAGSF